MTTELYTCRSEASDYRITKLDEDYNHLTNYEVSPEGCSCPQGHKPTCRHRKMLSLFLATGHIDDGWFFNFANRQWRPALTGEILANTDLGKVSGAFRCESSLPVLAASQEEPSLPAEPLPVMAPSPGRGEPFLRKRGIG